MLLGIISDTHDNLRSTTTAVDLFKKSGVDMIVHAGDWDMAFSMRAFVGVGVPIRTVLGNGDPDIQKFLYQLQNLKVLQNIDIDFQERMQDFLFDKKRIAVFHGNDDNLNKFIVESQLFDVYCTGHTHAPKIEKVGKTLIINPGSMVGWMLEEGNVPLTVAVYDSAGNKAKLYDIETGKEFSARFRCLLSKYFLVGLT